jgi:peptide/nickel transport system substrate-binding protein
VLPVVLLLLSRSLLVDPDVQKNRAEAREIMRNLGYGPDRRLQLKVSTRNIPPYRDPAVLLTDQLKEVFVDGELEIVETASWFPKVARKDYMIGANLTGGGVDDPNQQLYENYGCGSPRRSVECRHPWDVLAIQLQIAGDRV